MRDSGIMLHPVLTTSSDHAIENSCRYKKNIKENTFLENFFEPTKGRSFRLNNITDYVAVAAVYMKIIEG